MKDLRIEIAAPVPYCPTVRGFGVSDKPREKEAYADSALARDVLALIEHLGLDAVDILGFSMGCGTTVRLLMLHPLQVKSAILVGVGDYAIQETEMDFPKNWPVPESVPRPITGRVWAEEGAKILEHGEMVPGHLASAHLIAARVTGADPKVPAAVIRGAVAPMWPAEPLRTIDVPVLILNGKSDAANQKVARLLEHLPTARFATCDSDHHSATYQPTFHNAVIAFFEQQWRLRGFARRTPDQAPCRNRYVG